MTPPPFLIDLVSELIVVGCAAIDDRSFMGLASVAEGNTVVESAGVRMSRAYDSCSSVLAKS